MSVFLSQAEHTARKDHQHGSCAWCQDRIAKGERYHQYNAVYDGRLQGTKMHIECWEAFQGEFRFFDPGAQLGFDLHANDRGQPAKEDTIWEV